MTSVAIYKYTFPVNIPNLQRRSSTMGIADMYNVLNHNCKQVVKTVPLSSFPGIRVAVDVSIFLYKFVKSAGKERWIDMFVRLLILLKKYGMISVCIFDGPNPPPEKKKEQERRREQMKIIEAKLQECRRMLKIINEKYLSPTTKIPLPVELKTSIQTILTPRDGRGTKIIVDYDDNYSIADALKGVIERLARQTTPITDEHKQMAKTVINLMGIAQIQADGEAEALCAYLAIHGKVDAVMSEDTDPLAYGTPLLLSKIDMATETVTALYHADILECLEMTKEEFTDLCILLSCDYNERVVGYPQGTGRNYKKPTHIGEKAAFSMIKTCKRLEEVEPHIVDMDPLNYRRCRELFSCPASLDEEIVPYSKPVNKKGVEEFFKKYNVRVSFRVIEDLWKPTRLVFGGKASLSSVTPSSDAVEKVEKKEVSDADKKLQRIFNILDKHPLIKKK